LPFAEHPILCRAGSTTQQTCIFYFTNADLLDILSDRWSYLRGMARTLSETEQRHRTQRFLALADLGARVLTTAVKWGALVWMVYFAGRAFESLSGKQTVADIAVKVLGNLTISKYVCLLLAGGCTTWAVGERLLRRKRVADLTARLKLHETSADPGRSSSTLPPTGQTRKDDAA
jgi:hypothetical protein